MAKTDDVNDAESTISMLLQRQQQYKLAAVEAKRSGNMEAALGYVKVVKVILMRNVFILFGKYLSNFSVYFIHLKSYYRLLSTRTVIYLNE